MRERAAPLVAAAVALAVCIAVFILARRRAVEVALRSATRGGHEHGERDPSPETASASPRLSELEPAPAARASESLESGGVAGAEPSRPMFNDGESGWWIEGRFIDPDGRPVAGIPIYVGFSDADEYVRPDQQVHFTAGPDSEGGRAEARGYATDAVTSETGSFRVDASFTGRLSSIFDDPLRVVPCHPRWMEAKTHPKAEGSTRRAEPAASLSVRVVDDAGAPIPELRAIIRESARQGDHGILAKNGGFVMQWRRSAALPPAVHASLVVWANHRRIERREVTIPADRNEESITIDLGPKRSDGRLVIHPIAPPTSIGGRTVIVVLALPERPRDEVFRVKADFEEAERADAFVAALPPGRFHILAAAWESGEYAHQVIVDEIIEIRSG